MLAFQDKLSYLCKCRRFLQWHICKSFHLSVSDLLLPRCSCTTLFVERGWCESHWKLKEQEILDGKTGELAEVAEPLRAQRIFSVIQERKKALVIMRVWFEFSVIKDFLPLKEMDFLWSFRTSQQDWLWLKSTGEHGGDEYIVHLSAILWLSL